jgi:hypothetical protein
MVADFPIPRAEMPRVDMAPNEHHVRRAQMERMLADAMDEYDSYRDVDQGRVDTTRWKLVDTKGALRLYREREVGSGGFKSSSLSCSDDSISMISDIDDTPYEAGSAASLMDGRQKMKAALAVGELDGRIEDVVYALMASTQNELALVQSFLHDSVVDCAILQTMDGPTDDKPLQFLGYKWVVKSAPGSARLLKHRDVVYLESCGLTTTRQGEPLGYVLLESVDLPGFPEFQDRNCIRAYQSLTILVRQKSDACMDVFISGLVLPSGKMKKLSAMSASQLLLSVTKAMELAECKRLTHMISAQNQARNDALHRVRRKPTNCSLCHQQRKFYNGVSLVECSICGQVICTRCQSHKRVFVRDGIVGAFHRVGCCKTCVLDAGPSHLVSDVSRTPVKMSISAHLQRTQNFEGYSRGASFDLTSSTASRLRSCSESSLGDISENGTIHHAPRTLHPTSESSLPESVGSAPAKGAGITLLSDSVFVPDRSISSRSLSGSTRSFHLSSTGADQPDLRRASTVSGRYRANGTVPDDYALAIRPSPSPPMFSSSAPGGTYDLRHNMATPVAPTASRSSAASQQDLFTRMMELRRLAENTYQTTQQNHMMMHRQQQVTAAQRTPHQSR